MRERAPRIGVLRGDTELVCVPANHFDRTVAACNAALTGFQLLDPTLAFKDWEEGTTGYCIERALSDAARRCRVIAECESHGHRRRTVRLSVFRAGQNDLQAVNFEAYDKSVRACRAAAKILSRLDPALTFKDWEDGQGRDISQQLAEAARQCKAVADVEA